jgi:hypothetical protein
MKLDPISKPPPEAAPEGYIMVPRGFGLMKKVPYETAPDEKFLQGYSYGPGCGFYMFNRIFWPYLAWSVIVNIISSAMTSNTQDAEPAPKALLLFISFLPVIIYLVFLIGLGMFARRRRWERLPWKSFSHFRSDEKDWNIAGIIGWVFHASAITITFAAIAISCASN